MDSCIINPYREFSRVMKRQAVISKFFQPVKRFKETPLAPIDTATRTKLAGFANREEKRGKEAKSAKTPREQPKELKQPKQPKQPNEPQEPKEEPQPKQKPIQSPNRSVVRKKQAPRKKLTPLETQYLQLKEQHPDKLLAVQVGYKFKFFGEDARAAAHILNIMLIPGSITWEELQGGNFAYCLIPDNRLHVHLQRLLNHGYKVGVVKQTQTAAIKANEGSKSGLFERVVTGVYTKATYMGDEVPEDARVDDEGLGEYIMAIHEDEGRVSLLAVQPLTGDIVYDHFEDSTKEALDTRMAFLGPSEVLVVGSVSKETSRCVRLSKAQTSSVSVKSKSALEDSLASHFNGLHSEELPFYYDTFTDGLLQCLDSLLGYLGQFKLSNIFTITSNCQRFTHAGKYMFLPSQTVQSLEIFRNATDGSDRGTLFWLLDHTRTKMGLRLLRKWISRPLIHADAINGRLDAIGDITGGFNHTIDSFKNFLDKAGLDLEKLLIKAHYSAEYLVERISRKEVYLMLKCFSDMHKLAANFKDTKLSFKSLVLTALFEKLLTSDANVVESLLSCINPNGALDSNRETFFVLQGQLVEHIVAERNSIDDIEAQLDDELQAIQKHLNRPNLRYVTCLNQTHLIEVRNGKQVDALPSDWVKISGLKSISRFRTPQVTRLHKQLQYHQEKLIQRCDEAYIQFLGLIDANYEYFNDMVAHLATVDCLMSLSAASKISPTSRPQLTEEQVVDITNGRNPIIESLSNTTNYIPNDISMKQHENRVVVITGPNMGGKSSYVKQVALLVLMAHIGCYLPCDSGRLGIFDAIFVRMGASDDILKGQSTFMVEMKECANIVHSLTPRSLVILDEIGRGTGTVDGISLAYSILKYLVEDKRAPLTLFITHYPSLSTLEDEHPGIVANRHMGYLEKSGTDWPEVVFLYTLARGVVSNSYGLNVAKMAGLPNDIIEGAYTVANEAKSRIETDVWGDLLRALDNE